MTPIRYLYPGGIEAVAGLGGWQLKHGAPESSAFVSISEASVAIGAVPVVATAEVSSGTITSLLIDHQSSEVFGLRLSSLMNRQLSADTLYAVHGVAYSLGAVGYHCQQLAECYAAICQQFSGLPATLNAGGEARAVFGGQSVAYYEFDACITASRRVFEALRAVMWRAFDGKGAQPRNFETVATVLIEQGRLPHAMVSAIDAGWYGVGKRLADYRDCLHHYAPLDFGLASAVMERHALGVWTTRIRIPDNPEARSQSAFTFERNIDALEYCIDAMGALTEFATVVVDAATAAE